MGNDKAKFDQGFKPLLRDTDLARRLNCSKSKAYQLMRSGEIESVRIPCRRRDGAPNGKYMWRVEYEAVQKYLRENTI
jgi:hypothetical protein